MGLHFPSDDSHDDGRQKVLITYMGS